MYVEVESVELDRTEIKLLVAMKGNFLAENVEKIRFDGDTSIWVTTKLGSIYHGHLVNNNDVKWNVTSP